jgi:hypothetical protein
VAPLRRLLLTQPGDNTRPLPPTQHPRPLQQAARLQVLLLHRPGEGLPSDTDGCPRRHQNGDHHAVQFVRVPLHAFQTTQQSTDFPAIHGQPIQTSAFRACYLDNLIIASHTLEEHHEHLQQIFTILQENGLQINPAKCVFAAVTVEFLGHRVDQHGIWPLQRHVQAICDFPPPKDVKQLQQF